MNNYRFLTASWIGINWEGWNGYTHHTCPPLHLDMTDSKLFHPIQIGDIKLRHRVVLAPLTRFRADEASIPLDIMTTYYEQRASTKGTLLITEGTGVTSAGGAVPNMPCVETQQQLNAWKKVWSLQPLREMNDSNEPSLYRSQMLCIRMSPSFSVRLLG